MYPHYYLRSITVATCYMTLHKTHSLSFRPLVFPDSVVFRCDIPLDGRAEGVVSFDGKYSQPLKRGDSLVVKVSTHSQHYHIIAMVCRYHCILILLA
jgi:NAD kinase